MVVPKLSWGSQTGLPAPRPETPPRCGDQGLTAPEGGRTSRAPPRARCPNGIALPSPHFPREEAAPHPDACLWEDPGALGRWRPWRARCCKTGGPGRCVSQGFPEHLLGTQEQVDPSRPRSAFAGRS